MFLSGCKNPLSDESKVTPNFLPGFSDQNLVSDPVNPKLVLMTQPTTAMAGTNISAMQIQLQDENGVLIPLTGVPVTVSFNANPGSGVVYGTQTKSSVNGVVQFDDLKIEKAATGYKFIFSSTGYTSVVTSSFSILAGAPIAANSTLTTSAATVLADNTTAATLTATLKDNYNNPVIGASVQFAATGTGNTLVQPATTTNASGQVTGTIKSSVAGAKTISISTPSGLGSVTTSVTFSALTSFANVWSLDNSRASNYTLSSAGIVFNASNLAHKVLTIDQDNSSSYGFGAATTLSDTVWNTDVMELNATGKTNGTGYFISRIFSSPVNTNWTQIAWTLKFPACKALPNNNGVETGYTQYNVDMTGNVLLLHMDESSWSSAAGQVIDSSGNNIHGSAIASATTTASNGGKFDRAAALTTNGKYLSFPHSASLDNTTAVTVETWIYPTVSDSNPRGIISNRDSSTNTAYSIFLFTSGHVFIDIGGSSGTNRYDTGYVPPTNTWTHLLFVFDGSLTSNRLKFYVNGVLNYQTNPTPTSIPSVPAAVTYVGGLVGNIVTTFSGLIDEVAIYRRALTATEVLNRYNRAAQRIKFQVRACDMADCSDKSFVGPAASTTDYYTESLNTGITGKTSVALAGMTNKKYFQYKAVFGTSSASVTPQLSSVEVKPDIYDNGYPTVVNNTGVSYKTLTGFNASSAGSGEIRFQISNGTSWYYWNGAAWATASGFGQTNTVAEINANISSFPIQLNAYGTFAFKAFFNSGTNATDAASLSTVTVSGGN